VKNSIAFGIQLPKAFFAQNGTAIKKAVLHEYAGQQGKLSGFILFRFSHETLYRFIDKCYDAASIIKPSQQPITKTTAMIKV
jgi:hypothetical protein